MFMLCQKKFRPSSSRVSGSSIHPLRVLGSPLNSGVSSLEGAFCVRVTTISFPSACRTILALAPDAEVAYLNGDRTPEELHRMGITGIDYHINRFREHPEWVEEAHRLGMNVNVWTVDKPEDIRAMQALGVDYITTNEPALCESIIR